jgi:tetratricopeptide (TPR) repeat protein
MFRFAIDLFETGQLAEAESACRKMTLAYPQAAEAMHLAGLVAMKQGNGDIAAERMGRAAIADANNAEIQHDHAQALKAVGKLREAVGAFKRAIRLCPPIPIASLMNLNWRMKTTCWPFDWHRMLPKSMPTLVPANMPWVISQAQRHPAQPH